MSAIVVTHHRFSGHDLSVDEQQAIRRALASKMRVLEITPLSIEALALCERLSKAYTKTSASAISWVVHLATKRTSARTAASGAGGRALR